MKLELRKIVNLQEPLSLLGTARGLKSVVAYRISKNIRAINKEIEEYNTARIKIVEEYSEKDESGKAVIKENGTYDIPDENLETVNKELAELLNEEVEIEIRKVFLEDIEKAGLSAFDIEAIEFMIDFGEENQEG